MIGPGLADRLDQLDERPRSALETRIGRGRGFGGLGDGSVFLLFEWFLGVWRGLRVFWLEDLEFLAEFDMFDLPFGDFGRGLWLGSGLVFSLKGDTLRMKFLEEGSLPLAEEGS